MAGSAKKRVWNSRKNVARYNYGFARERAFDRPLRYESLEDRCLLSFGDLLHTLADPNTTPQANSQFGNAVAVDGQYTVVGKPYADAGCAYVFDTSTGALVATLQNPTPASGDSFGWSVAVSGSTVVVGADCDDTGAANAGSVYVFDAATGNLLWTLNNPTPTASDYFGSSVAVSGSTIVVGAYGDETGATDAGSAYVYDAATGSLLWTLNNPAPAASDYFGNSVAVSGSTVVVGAYCDDTGATDAGSAYLFDATTGNLLRTLDNPTPIGSDNFGRSVAISGSTVVVGAHRDDTGAADAGSAYLFDATTGNLLWTLNNPTPASSDYFGRSVAISGSTVVVGTDLDDAGATNAGSAYVFDTTTGNLLRILANPSPAANDNFGNSVGISDSTVVVGAYYDDAGVINAGSAYVFDAATGSLLRTLNNPAPTASDNFGRSVAVSDNTVIAGAYYDDTGATNAGSVYVFDAATGNRLWTLNNPSPAANDYFGCSVAVSGSTVVVGAYYDDTGATDAGSAYVFDAATGNLLWTFNNPTPTASDRFGSSVAISGNMVVVGACYDDTGATDTGSVYLFDATTGTLLRTLNNPAPFPGDNFGNSVAVSGNMVVVGAYRDDTGATDAGSAYVFDAAGNLLWTLNNPTPAFLDYFGYSVAVSGSTIVVGAYYDDTGATDAGSAYLFDAATGNLLRTLNNPTPAANDYFGYSVAISGSTVAVGAYYDDTSATDAGSAYLFDATTGNLLCTLNNPTPAASDYFGYSVAVSGSTVVVGAYGVDGGTLDRGAAYLCDTSRSPTDIALSASEIAENQPVNTIVGTFSTADPNLPDDAHTCSLATGTGDTDNVSFTIVGNQLCTTAHFDYETKNSYSVRVRTTDQQGLWFEKNFTITVTNVNEAPADLILSAGSIDENQPASTTVGTLTTTDSDDSAIFVYTLASGSGGDDNISFLIVGNQLCATAVFDYETKNSYAVRVRATDQEGLWFEKNFTITVTNVNEAPTDLTLSEAGVDENRAAGTIVGTLATTDPDDNATFAYALASGPGSDDNASFTIVRNQLRTTASFDYETKNSYTVRVRSTDRQGLWFEKSFTITVTNVNEAPTSISLSAASIDEHRPYGVLIGAFSASDPDAASSFVYTLVSGTGGEGNAAFRIDSSGRLVAAKTFNYEAQNSYSIRVRATDQGDLWFEKTFAIAINDVPETLGTLLASMTDPNTNPQVGSWFGYAVAVDGPYTVVGTPYADSSEYVDVGRAYVFNTGSGALVAALDNPTPAGWNLFGHSVAISGSTVVVGASRSAYVFDAATGNLLRTLNNPTPTVNDQFGRSVAISGSTVVVGANLDDTGATDAGSAYVFDAATGNLLRTLNNPTPAGGDFFGCSVAVSGNIVVVGAHADDTSATDAGSAYVFDATTGNLLWTLNNPTPASSDYFGRSVAISGSTVVVGAYQDDTGATDAGSAYVFDAATGNLLRTLNNPTPAAGDCFGYSVAVSGSTVVVGAYYDDTGAADAGSAYLFDAATGNLLRTLNNPTPVAYDYFGYSVAVSGSTVVVGAYYDDTGAADAGSAYVFDAATGNLLRTLNNPIQAAGDNFGYSMAVSGSTVVVGAYRDDTGATNAGAAYVFDAATGNLLWTLNNPNPAYDDYFGISVAISGSTVVVGASGDDTSATDVGSAYLFDAATGNLLWTLNNPNPASGDYFGRSVAISGSKVVVGAYGDNAGATDAGSAYVFDATTGNLLRNLYEPYPVAFDYFGWSVAVSGNMVVVGAYRDDTGAYDAGSAYVFDAATGNLLRTLNNPTPAFFDCFGYSVAISGNTVVVGAAYDDTGAYDAGSAYVFDAATGNFLRTLDNPTPGDSDVFGYSVAISGSLVVVGAYGDDTGATDAGSAYLFDAATGNLLQTFNNPVPAANDMFGFSVAVSVSMIVVGASGVDGGMADRGAAYVFDASRAPTDISLSAANIAENKPAGTVVGMFSTADSNLPDDTHIYTLVTGTGDANNISFTIFGNQLRTTASFDYETKNSYTVRVRSTDQQGLWFEKSFTITVANVNETPTSISLSAASIDEHRPFGVLVGVFAATDPDAASGFIYTLVSGTGGEGNAAFNIDFGDRLVTAKTFNYEAQNSYSIRVRATDQGGLWLEKTFTIAISDVPETLGTLLASLADPNTNPQLDSRFGYAVAVDGPYTVVGTPDADSSEYMDAGRAYVFNTSTGALVAALNNPTPFAHDYFGSSVAISGSTVVVGAYFDNTAANGAGSAYVFDAATGNLLRTLNNPAPAAGDNFGRSVAVSGSTVVVGADRDYTGATYAGSAYVFDAATGNLLRTLNNPSPATYDYFGYSVAISGSTVVVGAYGDDTGATDAGSAYLFNAATGNLLRTFNNPNPASSDYFGKSVAISGSTVVVGAYYDDTAATDAGSVYLFDAATGDLLWILNNPTPATNDYFGYSVAVSGTTVVVGAYYDDTGATRAGAAYVFDAATGNLLWTLNNPTPAVSDCFGNAVAISGSTIIVGACQDDTGATNIGSAYVFDAATGNLLRMLNNPTLAAGDMFGYSVAVSGDTVVVGAYRDDTGATDAGLAYVFDAATGNLLRTLNNPTPVAYDYFGYSVAVSGSMVVVGAILDDTGATDAGSAYVFDAATGNLLWTLNNPTPATYDYFGYSVAVSGSTVVVGAYLDDTSATNAGSAYVFDAATGNLLRTLNNPTPTADDYFGRSVAVSGTMVVVGAYLDDTGVTNAGSAYVFDVAAGNLLRTLTNPTPAADDYFGYSVAVSGSTVVVGAYGDDTGATESGSAYQFDAATGNLLRTLNNPTPAASDSFGRSVAVSGSTVVVGAYYDDTGATNSGSVYVFDAATGNLLRTLNDPVPAADDRFGISVAVSGGKAIVGAYGVDGASMDRGAAYVFDVSRAPTDIFLSAANIAENLPADTVVGTFSTTDPNLPDDTHIYTLATGTGDTDNASFTIVGNQLRTAASFDYETKNSHSIRVRTTDAGGLFFEKTISISVINVAPTLAGAFVRGSNWNGALLQAMADGAAGDATLGFRLVDGAAQLANSSTIVLSKPDQLTLRFNEAVNVTQNSLVLYNSLNQVISSTGFSKLDARTAQWTFAPLAANKYWFQVVAANTTDAGGLMLDGEWTTSSTTYATSGNGQAGGDLNFRFNVLAGDANGDGTVNVSDVLYLRPRLGAPLGATNWKTDLNASGGINTSDVISLRSWLGVSLGNFSEPTLPASLSEFSSSTEMEAATLLADPAMVAVTTGVPTPPTGEFSRTATTSISAEPAGALLPAPGVSEAVTASAPMATAPPAAKVVVPAIAPAVLVPAPTESVDPAGSLKVATEVVAPLPTAAVEALSAAADATSLTVPVVASVAPSVFSRAATDAVFADLAAMAYVPSSSLDLSWIEPSSRDEGLLPNVRRSTAPLHRAYRLSSILGSER